MRILLIEPDKVLADIYLKALKKSGHHVTHTSNAQKAVHVIDNQAPDIIVLELQLAPHNGVEFLYELRSYPEWHDIPVVILSAIPDLPLNSRVQSELGVSACLYKPRTNLQSLIRTIDRLAVPL